MAATGEVADTQSMLGAIIKKPKLSDNLLNKPPFRFLHDIVTEVNRETSFCEGLYDADEQNAASIKDKDGKIAYLEKIIALVGIALQAPCPAKPAKIVAGLEPENTNIFLQQLAIACQDAAVDRAQCVQRVLAGEKPPGGAAAAPPKKKEAEEERPKAAEPEPKATVEPKPKEKPKPKAEEPPPAKPQPAPAPAPVAAAAAAPSTADAGAKRPSSSNRQKRPSADATSVSKPAAAAEPAAAVAPAREPAEETYSGAQRADDDTRPARPSTARRAPPKVASNVVDANAPSAKPTVTEKPAAAKQPELEKQAATAKAGVILDGQKDDDDDDDLIVESRASDLGTTASDLRAIGEDRSQHGVLVRKILDSEQAAQGRPSESSQASMKDRQKLAEEVNKLRETVQALCQNTTQLGKCMDYVQEDLDNMNKEFDLWKGQKSSKSAALDEHILVTERTLEPLLLQIRQLDESLKEQAIKNANIKSAVMRNDVTIRQLVSQAVTR